VIQELRHKHKPQFEQEPKQQGQGQGQWCFWNEREEARIQIRREQKAGRQYRRIEASKHLDPSHNNKISAIHLSSWIYGTAIPSI
jgi:hypothetical protein